MGDSHSSSSGTSITNSDQHTSVFSGKVVNNQFGTQNFKTGDIGAGASVNFLNLEALNTDPWRIPSNSVAVPVQGNWRSNPRFIVLL